MNEQDRQAIEELFSRLAQAEQQAGPRDAEADAFIRQRIDEQPGAPYMMAQTIVMQNHALEQAQKRIQELESELAEAEEDDAPGGGIFGGLFGGGREPERQQRGSVVPTAGRPTSAPAGMAAPQAASGGGGFLAGAGQTAMGVAGGVLLGNAIGGMFGGGSSAAQAAPGADASATPAEQPAAQPSQPPAEPEPEPAAEESGGGFFESLFGGGDDSDF